MVHKLVLFWSKYGKNMTNIENGQFMGKIYTINWTNYGQNRTIKEIGQNMVKIWCIKWAKYGQDLDQIGTNVIYIGFVGVFGVYWFVCVCYVWCICCCICGCIGHSYL